MKMVEISTPINYLKPVNNRVGEIVFCRLVDEPMNWFKFLEGYLS